MRPSPLFDPTASKAHPLTGLPLDGKERLDLWTAALVRLYRFYRHAGPLLIS